MAEPQHNVNLRVPVPLYRWLAETAAATGMSHTAVILAALEAERQRSQKEEGS